MRNTDTEVRSTFEDEDESDTSCVLHARDTSNERRTSRIQALGNKNKDSKENAGEASVFGFRIGWRPTGVSRIR